jgi:hypothetical protein
VRKRTADSPTVTDLKVRDVRHCGSHETRHAGVVLDIALPGHGANPQSTVRNGYPAKLSNPLQVDDVAWADNPHREQWHQALTTGQGFGLVAQLRHQLQGFVQSLRSVVLKRWWLQGPNSPSSWDGRRNPSAATLDVIRIVQSRPSLTLGKESISHDAVCPRALIRITVPRAGGHIGEPRCSSFHWVLEGTSEGWSRVRGAPRALSHRTPLKFRLMRHPPVPMHYEIELFGRNGALWDNSDALPGFTTSLARG